MIAYNLKTEAESFKSILVSEKIQKSKNINVFFEDVDAIELPKGLETWLQHVSRETNYQFAINYIFCSDAYILNVNKEYLQHDYYTDIITFDLSEENSTLIESDIFISLDTVKSNSTKEKNSFAEELARVMSHGVFHLLGYNDKTEQEKEKMRALEEEAMQMIL